jgi:hypothetical protein
MDEKMAGNFASLLLGIDIVEESEKFIIYTMIIV